jgi:hypothetical protein
MPRRGRPQWEERHSRVQELNSEEEEEYDLLRNRSFVSDRLYFADEHDVSQYQVDDSSVDNSSESSLDYEAEAVAQSALARIQKAREKGKPHVRLTHEELEALHLSRQRRSPQITPSPPVDYRPRISPPVEYIRPRVSPPLESTRRRSRRAESPIREIVRELSPLRSTKRKDKERPQAWTRQRSQPRHFSATLGGPTRKSSSKASSKSPSHSSSRRHSRIEESPVEDDLRMELTRHKSHGERAKRNSRISSWPAIAGAHVEY